MFSRPHQADYPETFERPRPAVRGESGVGGTRGSDADRHGVCVACCVRACDTLTAHTVRERFAKAKYATASFVTRLAVRARACVCVCVVCLHVRALCCGTC
jgi:hypothetical protein